ncbi:unnamed protein product [Miscanthus lutarioriparius]|uniref:MsrB domain-containing protein n=1 Tax=Miscanthus lutarioriparius TaxID=422564 RepID=A0A811RVC8_9POAL|nr:unnamed protein product [Miscanthus lutarioriparius]
MSSSTPPPGPVQKSEEEWEAILTPEQFNILRRKGTEYPGTGEYDKFFEEGIYKCAGCGTPLYRSSTKFNSGCGWPAFYEGLPGAIKQTEMTKASSYMGFKNNNSQRILPLLAETHLA